MKNLLIIPVAIAALFLNSCGSGSSGPVSGGGSNKLDIPCWYFDTPRENSDCANVFVPGTLYAVGTAQSKDMSVAYDKAKNAAVDDLAGRLESIMKSVTNRTTKELGFGKDAQMKDNFVKSQERLVQKAIRGYDTPKKDLKMVDGLYVSYVLASINYMDVAEQLAASMAADKAAQELETHEADMEKMRDILKEEYKN